jgi:K(+)-stimulated pyrophosphate-energized sodium pump
MYSNLRLTNGLGPKLSSHWSMMNTLPLPKLFRWLPLAILVLVSGFFLLGAGVPESIESNAAEWTPFAIFASNSTFGTIEQVGLILTLLIAAFNLYSAFRLSKEVFAADQGTKQMQEIALAIRDGSNAYLRRQFTTVGVLVVIVTTLIIVSRWPWNETAERVQTEKVLAISRGLAFLIGSIFSATVGFFGMRLATTGNLRVAAAARTGLTPAIKLAYSTGRVTGFLTTGLGLLGGSLIVLIIGERAYETLLGFAFGGSLLALFMRVGGGIYTKAADVGADLVGKIEANIPEDDPRNAATIADNVGDNVGDCAGMAADVFESYAVTMVAAMILGYAAFGPKAMLFPLFVQAIGSLVSIYSTSLVGRKELVGGASDAMKSINRSFRIGALLSVISTVVLGLICLRPDPSYLVARGLERGLGHRPEVSAILYEQPSAQVLASDQAKFQQLTGQQMSRWYLSQASEVQDAIAFRGLPGEPAKTVWYAAYELVPVTQGLDLRPVLACLVGVILTLALMFCTEYWTSTEYSPVQSIVKASRTGHATNIIQGIAVGYESTVWSVLIIAMGIMGGVLVFESTQNPIFVAYGVALIGIGMLTLTGDTLSMDVFGPVADNANGIGEMGYNRDSQNRPLKEGDPDFIPKAEYKLARQILTDLDATGNTTKAITKGIAIGSAVVAAVSLFASFIAVLVKGSEEKINQLTVGEFNTNVVFLSVAKSEVFIGMLIGGAVPFLFSSMTIRAVGRAAFLIVNECRRQFRDPAIWDGTKKPEYDRVVDICTATAQRELIGPGLLAIFSPIVVGFLLGPFALGGFLAGMILSGQLLAVFMATSGGAWDNAKKMIEDLPKSETTGKGSEMHKASVTGDTVGDPLKDTAGPAINPLIKVMNMVSLLALPGVMAHNLVNGTSAGSPITYVVLVVGIVAIGWSWYQSKRDTAQAREQDAEFEKELEAAKNANELK